MPYEGNNFIWPGWETVRLIGRGSFGAVYEIVRDVFGHEERAALKVISIPQSESEVEELYDSGYDDASVTATFQSRMQSIVNEYSLMREMNGAANVVNCDDFRIVPHDNRIGWDIFIKMELLRPLTKTVGLQPDDAQVIRIARDMCCALALCRRHGIIHRDIKPQNIFVSPNGDYKLGDFGIAKTIEKTSGGTKVGTYKYMAPEVYNNRPYNMTADIYSLGLVLHWLLNERRSPFMPLPPAPAVASQEEEARAKRFAGVPIPPPAHGSAGLKRIVLKACAYEPRARYQSAEEMLRDLDALSAAARDNWVNEPSVPMTEPLRRDGWGESQTELYSQSWTDGTDGRSAGDYSQYSYAAPRRDYAAAGQPAPQTAVRMPEKGRAGRLGQILAIAGVALIAVFALGIGIYAMTSGASSGTTPVYTEPPVSVYATEAPVSTDSPAVSAWENMTGEPAQEVEAVQETAGNEPTPAPTPAPTPEPTPAPATVKAPGPDDLKALQNDKNYPNDIVFPKEQSYLSDYETMYVKSRLGNSIYLYWDSSGDASHRRSHYVLEKTEVTVLARENGFSCIIYKNVNGIMVSGWVDSQYLVYQYS